MLDLVGNVSTHSIRKTSTETMQNNTVIRDASNQRGRWKTIFTNLKATASNIYHMSFLRYLDLVAAEGLCSAGCCYYEVENLTDEMVLNIMPASKHLIKGVGYILCAAALWAYTNEPDLLPSTLKKRTTNAATCFAPHLATASRGFSQPFSTSILLAGGMHKEIHVHAHHSFFF